MSDTGLCARGCGSPRAPHANAKYCLACRAEIRRQPVSTLTSEQAAQVLSWRHQLTRTQIAQHVGVSRAQVDRYLRALTLTSNSQKYPDSIVLAVCEAYERLGRKEAETLFPDVKIRSIVERYKRYRPRQIRWTEAQIIEAARMGGLVSVNAQARYFGRPNAYEGSIKALWTKRFHCEPRYINGLDAHRAWHLVRPGTPAVLVSMTNAGGVHAKVLWLELVQHLRPDMDATVGQALEALATFQRWLHGTAVPQDIYRMIEEREGRPMDTPMGVATTNGHQVAEMVPHDVEDTALLYNAKALMETLGSLVSRVTEKEVTAPTVNAACNAAAQVNNIVKTLLDWKKFTLDVERQRRAWAKEDRQDL